MASPLHKTPLGLLELFRLKTLGRAPEVFGDTVLPVMPSREAYAAAEMQTASSASWGPGAINGVGGQGTLVTVASFMWIWGVSGQITLGAAPGTFITWEVGLNVPGTAQEWIFGCGDLRTVVAGETIRFGATLPHPVVLRAGSYYVARVHGDAAGADHVGFTNALYVPAANLT